MKFPFTLVGALVGALIVISANADTINDQAASCVGVLSVFEEISKTYPPENEEEADLLAASIRAQATWRQISTILGPQGRVIDAVKLTWELLGTPEMKAQFPKMVGDCILNAPKLERS